MFKGPEAESSVAAPTNWKALVAGARTRGQVVQNEAEKQAEGTSRGLKAMERFKFSS